MKLVSSLFFCAVCLLAVNGGEREVNPEKAEILVARGASSVEKEAARELRKHLALISGKSIPVRTVETNAPDVYHFRIGCNPGKETLKAEESVWRADESGCVFYGDPVRQGVLTAVYDFLEKQFGIRWIEPGDAGIAYRESKSLRIRTGEGRWDPGTLRKRLLRSMAPWTAYKKQIESVPEKFRMTKEQYERKRNDLLVWLKRQRMGASLAFNYGHAFVDWYQRYSKEHPDWFAMHEDGTRTLRGNSVYGAKLCVSNPEVVAQVVKNWARTKSASINTCENDGGYFCHCPACLKLDVRLPGEKLEDHLTDRYLNFTNRVLALAQKQRPDVVAVMYAYSYYRFPPRREKVMPNTILGFVPSMLELADAEKMYQQWHAAGAQMMFLRPNDQHVNTGLPMGFEKTMFDAFQLGVKYGIVGTDYDCIHGFWPATGIADYILARAHVDPSKPFEHWEAEYCSAFGAASDQVRRYYRYWRDNIWEKRLYPKRKQIIELGKYGNFRRGLMWYLDRYYRISDFDAAGRILREAQTLSLTPPERARLENLILANTHARLLFLAASAKGNEKTDAGIRLYRFRLENRDRLNFEWNRLFAIEQYFGDCAAANSAAAYDAYDAYQALPMLWRFQIDPRDAGLKEKWQESDGRRIMSVWDPIQIGRPWESQTLKSMHPALKKQLANYDGVGWYGLVFTVNPAWRSSEILLHFGAVDESAVVWVNGRKAGERIYQNPDDWKQPFTISIGDQIDWSKKEQTLVVRVHDSGGQGGIWKPVALVKQKCTSQTSK